jgi:ATP synthase, F0 subunit b
VDLKRIFGLDPQILFDTAITLLAMLILFILLSYLLFNPARQLIQKRKAYIQGQLDEAAAARKDALGMKADYDSRLARVDEESAELLTEARKKAQMRENDIVAQANEEARRIVVRAEKEVALEKDKVRDEMKQEMVQVATLMAGRFVAGSMDEATQAKLVDETLKDMGDATWQN